MEDRRGRKTKEAIRAAFLALLEEKSINKITVAEVSRMADLGRGTFYLHYRDVYDLYDHIEGTIYTELEQIYDACVPNDTVDNLLQLARTVTEFVQANRQFFVLFARPDNAGTSLNRLKEFLYAKVVMEKESSADPSREITERDVCEAVYIVSGSIGVVEKWILTGFRMPSEEVASILQAMILRAQTPAATEPEAGW